MPEQQQIEQVLAQLLSHLLGCCNLRQLYLMTATINQAGIQPVPCRSIGSSTSSWSSDGDKGAGYIGLARGLMSARSVWEG